jgi:hypothetical protein
MISTAIQTLKQVVFAAISITQFAHPVPLLS